MKKLVALASGQGTNFCAIADAIQSGKLSGFKIEKLICNKKDAPVLAQAEKRGISTLLLDSSQFRSPNGKFSRKAYEKRLLEELQNLKPDWIVLAGYMLVLGETIVEAYPNRILNIHPSLLPKFPGMHAIEKALKAGEKETGCTVHFVTAGVDEGPVILQNKISLLEGDTAESVHERLRPVEHQTYIEALRRLLA